MAENRTSVFMPVDPSSLEGPFSGFLRPPAPAPQASEIPAAGISTAGGIAMAMSKFLESATQGRIKSYEERENAKLRKLTQLNQYMTSVYPTLTPEGQQEAMKLYSRAVGPEVLNAMGNGKKGKGGVSKDELPSRDGKQTQGNASTTGDVHRHFTGILKDIALGMVGGKMPKGAPDVDLSATIGNIALIADDPKYNREKVIGSSLGEIQKGLEGFSGTQEEALTRITPHLQQISRLDPGRADSVRADYLGRFQPAPKPGTKEYVIDRLMNPQAQSQSPTAPTAPPPGPVTGPVNVRSMGQAGPPAALPPDQPTAAAHPGPPQAPAYDSQRALLHQYAGSGQVGDPKDIEVTDGPGKTRRATAYWVNYPEMNGIPGFAGWVDTQTLQPVQGSVRIASTAEPKAERFSTAQTVKGDPKWGGDPKKFYRVQQSEDNPDKFHVIGEVADPTRARTPAARPDSPALIKARRDVAASEAVSKILEQTPWPTDDKGKPVEGKAALNYFLDHVEKYYKDDRSVGPYLKEVIGTFTELGKKGAFRDVGDIRQQLTDMGDRAKQQVQHQETQQKIDNLNEQVQGMVGDVLGIDLSGGRDPEGIRQ
jgi:hypothetical protein